MAMGAVYLATVSVTVLATILSSRHVLVKNVLRPCCRKLKDVTVSLWHGSIWGCAGQSSRNDFGFSHFVYLSKHQFRRRLARLISIMSVVGGVQHWLHRTSYTPCVFDASPGALALREVGYLGSYSFVLLPLLPDRILGSRGMTIALVLSSLCHLVQLAVIDTWWIYQQQRVFTQSIYRFLQIVSLDIKFSITFGALQASVLCIAFVAKFGLTPIHFYEDHVGVCFRAVPEPAGIDVLQNITSESQTISAFTYTLRQLFTGCAICVALLTLDWMVELGGRALAHFSHMETQKKAFSSIIEVICDCMVYLDGNLEITEPAPKLAALLIRGVGQQPLQLVGQDMRALLASEDDVTLLTDSLLKEAEGGYSRPSSLMHLHMKDALGTKLTVEVHWTRYEDMNGKDCFILGITEAEERPICSSDVPLTSFGNSWDTRGAISRLEAVGQSSRKSFDESSFSSCTMDLDDLGERRFTFNLEGEIFDTHDMPDTLEQIFGRRDDLIEFMGWVSDTMRKVTHKEVSSPYSDTFRICRLRVLKRRASRSGYKTKYVKAGVQVTFDLQEEFGTWLDLTEFEARLVPFQSATDGLGTSHLAVRNDFSSGSVQALIHDRQAASPTRYGRAGHGPLMHL
eukprot:TRINITY_DN15193_c0_g1_i1.p1 TRINITY_DN15193_c0_g1~~TRINITY_DN15193_c0_g1_i1.p1  ORF type:complete len:626 (-),score=64.83 TRINITY_DN15193_c0_g1_i1:40-1917(-)